MERCQFSGNFLISGNFARNFLISGNLTLYKRIGNKFFPGNFRAFQEILTIVTGISMKVIKVHGLIFFLLYLEIYPLVFGLMDGQNKGIYPWGI